MGRRRGRDLHVAGFLQALEGAHQVSVEAFVVRSEDRRMLFAVETREPSEVVVPFGAVALRVPFSRRAELAHVFVQMLVDERVPKLFDQNRSQANGELEGHGLIAEVPERLQQRNVAPGSGFMDPVLTVRPAASLPTVGEVGVEDKREGALFHTTIVAWGSPAVPPARSSYEAAIARRDRGSRRAGSVTIDSPLGTKVLPL